MSKHTSQSTEAGASASPRQPGGGRSTFAVFFGNRGFFPASLQAAARREMTATLEGLGYGTLMLDAAATRHGAVETPSEGALYARFLQEHRGEYDGVLLCLPNFGDETGAVAALKDAGVPILIQAYPDEMDKMAPELRRDSFCGKFSIMDVFYQYGLPFTALKPHTVSPGSPRFAANLDYFDRLCQVVKGLRNLVVGAIGARTTAFKTVRIDELALQRHGVTVETFDLSLLFARIEKLDESSPELRAKSERLRGYARWDGVPDSAFRTLCRMSVVIDQMIEENGLDAVAIRCWIEMQEILGVSPCVLLSEMNDRGIVAACELDVGNAVMMKALSLASGQVATLLDWNNNFRDEDDKCILFHCGPVPQSMMSGPGRITDHDILKNTLGEGRAWGCNIGRIAPTAMTYGSLLTDSGRIRTYLGQGRFTDDSIPQEFFGCAGVAEIPNLQDALQAIGYGGFRHHVSVTPGHVLEPVHEALEKYLGYEVMRV
ncbi:MAG: fucose isomerase [Spirochaetales bacterium]|nr:fucose isomerase [Spirochaetales bacterium]